MFIRVKSYDCPVCEKEFSVSFKDEAKYCPFCKNKSIELQLRDDINETYWSVLIPDPDKKVFNNLVYSPTLFYEINR